MTNLLTQLMEHHVFAILELAVKYCEQKKVVNQDNLHLQ